MMNPLRRERLAAKGRRLCEDCVNGTACAEGFIRHHLEAGEREVANDLAEWLDKECEVLRYSDPESRLLATRELLKRVQELLAQTPE